MVDVVKVVEIVRPKVRFGRPDRPSGDMCVWINDFEFITIHYDYRYTDNNSQWSLAEQLARAFGWTPDDSASLSNTPREGK
jgi:hypothetical protein